MSDWPWVSRKRFEERLEESERFWTGLCDAWRNHALVAMKQSQLYVDRIAELSEEVGRLKERLGDE